MGKKVSEKKEMTDKQKKVKAILEKLQNLQGLLVQRYKIEQELEEIPKAILKDKEVLVRMKKQFDDDSEALEKRLLKVKDLRYQLQDAEEKRQRYEQNMEEAKTQKEYEVLDKAIKEAIAEEQQLRKDLVREDKETAEQNMKIEAQQKLIDGQAEEIRLKEEETQSKSDAKKQELEAIKAKIQNVLEKENKNGSATIGEELLFKFERIIKSRGKGIVSVGVLVDKDKKEKDEDSEDGKEKEKIKAFICSECHMVLPIQFVNDVHRMDSIMFCPYCSRILFFDDKINDQFSNADISEGESFGVFADSGDDDDSSAIDDFEENEDITSTEGDDDAVFGDDDEAVFDDENAEEENELLNEEGAEFGENPEEYDENSEEEDEESEDSEDEDEDEDPDADYDDSDDDDDEDEE
jgi:predicted  nucleic acid-binding Zn-ribbon protein